MREPYASSHRLDSRRDRVRPRDLATDPSLSRAERIRILREWRFDEVERMVAEEENMGGGEPSRLDEVDAALFDLGAGSSRDSTPTATKHGTI